MPLDQPLSDDQLRSLAPAIFADKPHRYMSKGYSFVPTIKVINKMRQEGFLPVAAGQARSVKSGYQDPDKDQMKRHVVRFRRQQDMFFKGHRVGDEIPEIVLNNSHDGSSHYALMAGLFRLVCANGMVVASADFGSYSIRHDRDEVNNIIEASYKIIKETPLVMNQVDQMKKAFVSPRQQLRFAEDAIALRGVELKLEPREVLISRRPQDGVTDQRRSVWQTFNVVQEHLVKGGASGITGSGRSRRLQAIRNPVQDVSFNRDLWTLADTLRQTAYAA